MELSPARQRVLFAVIVVVLAALGYYLVLPGLRHHAAATPSPSSTATPSPSTSTSSAAAPAVTAVPVAAPSAAANIYDWLPFTQADLADAAALTVRFCVDYETYTYTESAAGYIGPMSGLTTSELLATLQQGYSAPGVASLRTGQKQISSGTASITSLRAFGQTSMTFVVAVGQHLVSSKGTTSSTTQFAVTVTGSGDSWQVSDIELASLGNT
jgi:3-oxoacyl-ACP reductase-like protein